MLIQKENVNFQGTSLGLGLDELTRDVTSSANRNNGNQARRITKVTLMALLVSFFILHARGML